MCMIHCPGISTTNPMTRAQDDYSKPQPKPGACACGAASGNTGRPPPLLQGGETSNLKRSYSAHTLRTARTAQTNSIAKQGLSATPSGPYKGKYSDNVHPTFRKN